MRRAFQSVLLVASLIVLLLTGCEPVGGLDLNEVLIKASTQVQSVESSSTLTLDFSYDKALVDEETKKVLDLFDGSKLELHSVAKDQFTASLDGKLSLKAGDIPFQMTVDLKEPKIVVYLNNDFSKPFLLQDASALGPEGDPEKSQQLQKDLISYFVKHLPNPKTVSVKSTTENIHNENVPVKQIHAELYGQELQDYLLKLVENILKDPEELAKVLSQLAEITGEEGLGEQEDLKMTEEELKAALEEIKASTSPYLSMLDENTYLKADLYVDSQLFPRKEVYEIGFALPNQSFGFKLHFENEIWNINKQDLDIKKIESSEYLTEFSTDEEVLDALNRKGTLYHILKELKVFRNEIQLTIGQKQAVDNGEMVELDAAPYIKQNRTLVPLRFVSESLGAEVGWDAKKREITVRDSGTEIVLKPGSNRAVVNGKQVNLDVKVEIVNNRSFVPLRFISETMGYDVEWNGQLRMITLSKDLLE